MTTESNKRHCQRALRLRFGPVYLRTIYIVVHFCKEMRFDPDQRLPTGITAGNSPRLIVQLFNMAQDKWGGPLAPPPFHPVPVTVVSHIELG